MTNQAPSLTKSLLTGAIGFGLVSLCVFATVAFGERWMYRNLGLGGAYVAWTIMFIALGGAVLGSLVVGRWRLPKFYLLYGLAFFVYAVNWTAAYFILRGAAGEWVGSLAGSIMMALVFAAGFEKLRAMLSSPSSSSSPTRSDTSSAPRSTILFVAATACCSGALRTVCSSALASALCCITHRSKSERRLSRGHSGVLKRRDGPHLSFLRHDICHERILYEFLSRAIATAAHVHDCNIRP